MKFKKYFKRKNLIKTIIALIFAFLFLVLSPLFIKPKTAFADDVDSNYYFERIDVKIDVRKDKTYAIEEKLTTVFKSAGVNTGIIRDIQRISSTTRIRNGETIKGKKYISNLTDVSVSIDGGEAKVTRSYYNNGDFFSIKMQKPDESYFGASEHVFTLNYIYDMSADKVEGFDDFTLDVLGYAMAYTRFFTAEIFFPDNINAENVSVRTNGKFQWSPNSSEVFRVNNNKVYLGAIPNGANIGYTVQVLFDDGYFNVTKKVYPAYYAIFALSMLAIIGGAVFFVLNLSKKPVVTVEFYPPENLSIMRFSAVLKKGAKSKHAAALILKWASTGLVKIKKDGKRHLILYPTVLPKNVVRSKGGEKDSLNGAIYAKNFDNAAEKAYFNVLFSGIGGNGCFSTRAFKKAPRSKKEKLGDAVSSLVSRGNVPSTVEKVYKKQLALCLASLIPAIALIFFNAILTHAYFATLFCVFLIAGTAVGTMFYAKPEDKLFIILIFPIAFFGLVFGVFIATVMVVDYFYLAYIAIAWWALNMFVLPHFLVRRTNKANSYYGKILGFKNFLLKAEMPRVELLFEENPDYFVDIVPYLYILGISDKVLKRFEKLQIAVPDYISNGISMGYVTSCIAHAGVSRSAYRSSWSGGGSGGGGGGGGSSGGGGGGGGSRGC